MIIGFEFSLEERRVWGNLRTAFQFLKGNYETAGEGLLIREVKDSRFILNVSKNFFIVTVVRPWHRSPEMWLLHHYKCSGLGWMGCLPMWSNGRCPMGNGASLPNKVFYQSTIFPWRIKKNFCLVPYLFILFHYILPAGKASWKIFARNSETTVLCVTFWCLLQSSCCGSKLSLS